MASVICREALSRLQQPRNNVLMWHPVYYFNSDLDLYMTIYEFKKHAPLYSECPSQKAIEDQTRLIKKVMLAVH